MKKMVRVAAILAAMFVVSAVTAQTRRPPTVDDLLDLVQISSAQISPDGTRVLFTRSELKPWKENKRATSIWIARADGLDAYKFLGHERDRSPAWSPDGTHVAFLSSRDQGSGDRPGGLAETAETGERGRDAGAQVWLIRTTGGEAWKLTDHKGSIRSFEWAGDSRKIFFVSDNAKSDEEKAAEKAGDDAIFVDEGANGQGRARFSKVWTIDVQAKQERALTVDERLIGDFT